MRKRLLVLLRATETRREQSAQPHPGPPRGGEALNRSGGAAGEGEADGEVVVRAQHRWWLRWVGAGEGHRWSRWRSPHDRRAVGALEEWRCACARQAEAAFVDEAMVGRAQEDEVGQAGPTPVDPMMDVVGVDPAMVRAAGEAAAAVPDEECSP